MVEYSSLVDYLLNVNKALRSNPTSIYSEQFFYCLEFVLRPIYVLSVSKMPSYHVKRTPHLLTPSARWHILGKLVIL